MRLLFFVTTMFFFSCGVDESLLIGKWRATAYYENGQSIAVPLDSIVLVFNANDQYQYQTLGQYRESGRYRTDLKYLFLKDSSGNASSEERLMRILYLSRDSLKLLMGAEGKDLVLFLGRQE